MTQPLDRAFNVAVRHIADKLFPTGFDVSAHAPETLPDITIHIERTGRMRVWSGASDQTIFGCTETNWAFRAWHDWTHWRYQYPFTPVGEAATCAMQQSHLITLYGEEASRVWRIMLDIEINGQIRYAASNGDFPSDQHAFMVRELIKRGIRLL